MKQYAQFATFPKEMMEDINDLTDWIFRRLPPFEIGFKILNTKIEFGENADDFVNNRMTARLLYNRVKTPRFIHGYKKRRFKLKHLMRAYRIKRKLSKADANKPISWPSQLK